MRRIIRFTAALASLIAPSVEAATYSVQAAAFAWETATTDVVWEETNTSYPRDDDKQLVNLGFTFSFGGVSYTQVRILTNGALHFGADQNFHQDYTNEAMSIGTADRVIAPYWDDLNPDGGGTVRYSMLGSAPDRRFVVSWEGVPVYPSTGSYTFQAVLYETGDIKFQYGAGNANGASATIGVEIDNNDFTQYSYNTAGAVGNGTAILFTAPAPLAYYAMEETTWSGGGSVLDEMGSYHGSPLGAAQPVLPATATPPGTCRAADIPTNTNMGTTDAIDTGIDIDAIGSRGTISFWYSSNTAWNDGAQRMLFDASNNLGNGNADKNFYLVKQGNGRLRFQIEDSNDNDTAAVTGGLGFAADTWHHITAAWDLPADRVWIYVDGALAATSTTNVNGMLGNTATLYIGDHRSNGMQGTTNYTGNSANGMIDEVRIYNYARSPDMNLSRPCPGALDHIRLLHDGEGLTCAPEQVVVQACVDTDCTTLYTDTVTTTLQPAGWVGGDTITFTGGSATVELRHTAIGTVTLDATGTSPTPPNTARCFNGATETCSLNFVDSGFIFDVPTLTACKTSASVTVRAVKTSDTGVSCAPAFSGTRSVAFWSSYSDPATGTQSMSVNDTPVATASPGTPISLDFDANAAASITVSYPDAGRMQLNARYEGSGAEAGLVMTGNDFYVSVPVGLAVYAASSCAAGDASCPVFSSAGNAFNLTVKAACWVADGDADLSDNPATPNFVMSGIPLTHNLISPDGGQPGTLGTGAFDFVTADNGVHAVSQTVTEVGVFRFTATPAAAGYFGETVPPGTSPNIGRFTPAYFDVTRTHGCPVGSFTYSGQPFAVTATARAVGGSVTANYHGPFGFAKDTTISNAGNASNFTNHVLSPLDFANGVRTQSDVTYTFPAKDTLPVTLTLRATDADGVSSAGHIEETSEIRSGRVYLANAIGSELLPLPMPLRAQYYTVNGFVTNPADSCTSIPENALTLTNGNGTVVGPGPIPIGTQQTSADVVNAPMAAGDAGLSFSPPGTGGEGYIDVTAGLGAIPWLRYDWDGNGLHDNDPVGRASFGLYRGDPRHIYLREVY